MLLPLSRRLLLLPETRVGLHAPVRTLQRVVPRHLSPHPQGETNGRERHRERLSVPLRPLSPHATPATRRNRIPPHILTEGPGGHIGGDGATLSRRESNLVAEEGPAGDL